MALANALVRAGACGVEVAQMRELQAMRRRHIAAGAFDHQLGPAVRADRPLRMRLIHRQTLRIAVSGAGRGEHECTHTRFAHHFKQGQRTGDVGVVKALGKLHRLADLDERRAMQHRGRLVAREHLGQPRFVANVATLERAPFHETLVAIVEIIVNHDVMPRALQRQAAMRADITGPARNKNCRHVAVLLEP